MNRSYDQGLGLLDQYSMMFFVCTGFFNDSSDNFHALFTGKYKRIPLSEAAGSLKRCHPDSNWRIKVLQTFALPLGYGTVKKWSGRRDSDPRHPPWQGGTLPTELLPHKMCLGAESNHRHCDFQSHALPTELPRQIWRPGRGSNPRPPA